MLLFFHKSTITLLVKLSAIFPKWQECVGMLITDNSCCPPLEYFQCTPTIAARTIQLWVILMVEVLILISIINCNKQKIEVHSFCSVVIEYSDLTSALHSSEAWVTLLCFKVVLVYFVWRQFLSLLLDILAQFDLFLKGFCVSKDCIKNESKNITWPTYKISNNMSLLKLVFQPVFTENPFSLAIFFLRPIPPI